MPSPRQEFDECPWADYGYRDELPHEALMDGGPYEVDRYAVADIPRRVYTWHLKRDRTERRVVDAFLANTHLAGVHSFYVRDPADDARADVPLGTGDGGTTTFFLPSTGEERRHYPRDDGDLVVKVAGTPVTVSSVDTDARSVTLAAPPGIGLAVTADFNGLRLVRQLMPHEWKGLSYSWFDATIVLEEILTD